MKTFIKIISLLTLATLLAVSVGCKKQAVQKPAIADYDYSQMNLVQLDAFSDDEETLKKLYESHPVAVVTTSLGEIKIVLYPEYAPNTVERFIERVNEGFYDNSDIFGVRKQAFYAGVNESGKHKNDAVENEYSVNLWPFKGSIMSYSDPDKSGFGDSRFFVINDDKLSKKDKDKIADIVIKEVDGEKQKLPSELLDAMYEHGGAISQAGLYTVFGQTVEGFDVIEQICKVKTDKNEVPKDEIKIISIKILGEDGLNP